MITIVDYGMGNLRSVQKAFERLGHEAEICSQPEQIATAGSLVLPGVGAFRDAIAELTRQGLVDPIREHVAADRPFLGICLGLQLLFDRSHEDGEWDGLGIVPGEVVRFDAEKDFPADLKIPHMGWNTLDPVGPTCPLLTDIPSGASFYFVHSYYVAPTDDDWVVGRTDYGLPFASMIGHGRMFATQFHPEKSQRIGLQLLSNFADL
ncbi:MAG: imidazole glycerol phosphate synthase subunit HisH [Planctomycetaceae bacterium]|jgi:glutamine amidotransferase|nr:imidazole glycerol phosphate synthase subunit HisH [Planctomycetaceae bacterium]MDP7277656.1 imidazole glycerol phosphate synthase subunit HisH [Planctomycetaceae bacterium]